MDSVKVFSPGSVTNVSCGYDILGFCLDNVGDTITVTKTPEKGIKISSIDKYDLPTDIDKNVGAVGGVDASLNALIVISGNCSICVTSADHFVNSLTIFTKLDL